MCLAKNFSVISSMSVFLLMICATVLANADELHDPSADNWDETTRRLAELQHFILPLPDTEIDNLANHVARLYFPVNASSGMCRNHSNILMDKFLQKDRWALEMWDSSSKPLFGVLDGHLTDLGNYQRCIKVKQPENLFLGQLCVIRTVGVLPDEVLNKSYNALAPRDVTFSLCVPSSCSENDVAAHVDINLAKINASTRYSLAKAGGESEVFLNYYLSCSTTNPLPFRPKDYIAISVFSILAVIVIASTCYENAYGSDAILSVFSLKTNLKGLMDTRTPSSEISCFNGLRVLCCVTVVLSHIVIRSFEYVLWMNQDSMFEHIGSVPLGLLQLFSHVLDVFFMMSGTVIAYSYFNNVEQRRPFKVLKFYYSRYFRLTPVFAAVMLFYATLLVHIGDGPMWKSSIQKICETNCVQFWWTGLLHISAYVNGGNECLSHSWYIATDFQLCILAPIFLTLLNKRRRAGVILVILGLVAPVVGASITAYTKHLYTGIINGRTANDRPSEVTGTQIEHTNPLFRLPPFLLGIAMGLLLSSTSSQKGTLKVRKIILWCGWLTSVVTFIGLAVTTVHLTAPEHEWSPWLDPLCISLSRPLFAAVFAWITFCCFHGYGGIINDFLSWNAFRPLARLTYSVYIIHYVFVYKQLFKTTLPLDFNYTDVVIAMWGDLVLSYFFGAILYLAVEIPCMRLALRLYPERTKSENSTSTATMSDLSSIKAKK